MKTFRLITFSFIFTAFLAVSALAQAQPVAKVALVNTEAFYLKQQGIKKIEIGYQQLENEFKPINAELTTMNNKLQALKKEIEALQNRANDPNNKVPIDPKQLEAKVDEYQKLETDGKRKSEDAKKEFEKREVAIMGPISQDIGKSLGDFAKQKGYTLVLDSSKLIRSGILLYSQDATDITKEFITYYNSRPGGTATTKP